MSETKTIDQLPVYVSSSICASVITHPIDVMKVKFQTNTTSSPLRMMSNTYTRNGMSFLFKGLRASILRNGSFVSTKMFAYDQFRSIYNSSSFQDKLISGMGAGLTGSIVGTPFDLIMVRIQNNPVKYPDIHTTITKTYNREGLLSFWKGSSYTMSRAIIVTTCQFAIYEEMKEKLRKSRHLENECHIFLVASVTSSLITSILSNPLDVCKTRMMTNKENISGIYRLIGKEGVKGIYRGLSMNICRQVPLNLIRFSFLETFRCIYNQVKNVQV